MRKLLYLVFILTVSFSNAFPAEPVVTSVSPLRQVINAPRGTSITVNFNTAVNTSSVNNSTFRVFGKQSGPIPGVFEFLSGNTQVKFTPSSLFLAGEWVTVNLSKGILAQDNTPMTKGFAWNFWTKAEPGTLSQTLIRTIPVRRQGEGLIQCYGALGCDFNDDGKTDLAIVNEVSKDFRVFLNNGTGYDTMNAIYPLPAGSYPSPSEAADFNRDGIVDMIVGNAANNVLSLFMGTGNANFLSEVPYIAGNNVRGVAVADLDGDGFDDIVTANRSGSNISLFRNNGNSTFGTATNINTVGNSETAVMMADANNDGILDAFVGCYASNEIVLMLGDGNGSFTFSSRSALNGPPWAIVVGDINGDGNVDVAACLSSANRIGIIFGNGAGGLGAVTNYLSGSFPLAIDIGDVDGDNDLDIISSQYIAADFRVFQNTGNGVLSATPVILPSSGSGSCITVHDRDNDGDLDLSGIDEVDDLLFVFNNGPVGINQISSEVPSEYSLEQNYPNPFNPSTVIRYSLIENRLTNLKIYDLNGREVANLINENQNAGTYEIEWNASGYSSGVYFYELTAGNFRQTKRMLLIK